MILKITLNEFLAQEKEAFKKDGIEEEYYLLLEEIKQDHYLQIVECIKKGYYITQEVFKSLDSLKKFHFLKHYGEIKIVKEEVRTCTCGSGIFWADCPGITSLETPWEYCG